MNRCIFMGRLTRDPQVRYSGEDNSMAIARYTLAINRYSGGNHQEADFIPCVAFKQHAEFAEKNLYQGMRILVSGRIQTGSYINKEGQKVYTTELIIDSQEFADSKAPISNDPVSEAATNDEFETIPDDAPLPY